MTIEPTPAEEKPKSSTLFPDSMFTEERTPTVFMPEFVTSFLQEWINSSLGSIVIIIVTALVFAVDGVMDYTGFSISYHRVDTLCIKPVFPCA